MAAFWLGGLFTLPTILHDFANGFFWSAMGNVVAVVALAVALVVLRRAPHRFAVLVNLGLVVT